MSRTMSVLLAAAWILSGAAAAQEVSQDSVRPGPQPLFTSDDVLVLTLEGPLKSLLRERGDERNWYPGVLRYQAPGGSNVTLDVELRTRGHYRRQKSTCSFPPLRVNFKKPQVEGTIFAGQNRLDLTVHCQDRKAEYEQFVLQEYLIYRSYNLLTSLSLRARLARVTYVDTEGSRDTVTKFGFFVEEPAALAARNGWKVLEVPQVPPSQMDQAQLAMFEVFQFMIGNTDWDPFLADPTTGVCCHNALLIGAMAGPVLPIPYDFDWSGLISAPYAKPDPVLGIRSVRQRRFWGICRPREELTAVLPAFNVQREAIYALFRDQPGLEPRLVQRTLAYLDEFYETINNPNKVTSAMLRDCRKT